MITLVLHIANSEPIKVDVDEMPKPSDSVIVGKNPRERTDKELHWVDDGVTTIMVPWHRLNYVQVLPDPREQMDFPELYRAER